MHAVTGDVDVLFLGMECDGAPLSWLYGPLITKPLDRKIDHSRRLSGSNYERGIDIVTASAAGRRTSTRWVWSLGSATSWPRTTRRIPTRSIASDRLIEDCRERGIVAERLFGEKEIAIA